MKNEIESSQDNKINNETDSLKNSKNLEDRINEIVERNKRVELDKKWETSLTRRICICIMTYAIVLLYSYLIRNITSISIFFTSFVPVIGFTLSNLSLRGIRKIWEKNKK